MKLFHHLEDYHIISEKPLAITIGNFDGVHKGHQALLQRVHHIAKENKGYSAAITFKNHPSSILRPSASIPLVCTLEHRLKLIENEGIDFLVLLEFTKEFSEQSAEVFLKTIRTHLPFTALILGPDATLGKNKEGNHAKIEALSHDLQFKVEYLSSYLVNQTPVSSSKIRELIQAGNLKAAEEFLGRKYSIYSKVIKGEGKGKKLGFPTANIEVQGLSLPPLGVYAIRMLSEEQIFDGIANLGIAPTVRTDNIPVLEVHLFDREENLYDKSIEVIFYDYIRPEIRFANLTQLKEQIAKDIVEAKLLLT